MASEETVARISHLRGRGYTQKEIAEDVGLSPQMVSVILKQLREQSNEVKPVQVVVTQNLEPKDTVIEFTPAEFERLRQEQTIYAVEEKLFEIRPNLVHTTTLPSPIHASRYAEIADIVESGFDLNFSHDFASERRWLANCHRHHRSRLEFEIGVTPLEEIEDDFSTWLVSESHVGAFLHVWGQDRNLPWLDQREMPEELRRSQSDISAFQAFVGRVLSSEVTSQWLRMVNTYHPNAPENYDVVEDLRYVYDQGIHANDITWLESGDYNGKMTHVYRSSLLEEHLRLCMEEQPFLGAVLFLEALSGSSDESRRESLKTIEHRLHLGPEFLLTLVSLLPFSEEVFERMAYHLETDLAVVEQIESSGAPNQEALQLIQQTGSLTWEEHLEKQEKFNRDSFLLSEFKVISSLEHPKVERLRDSLHNEQFNDALIHAWTLFEVEARKMWNDHRIHSILKADPPRTNSNSQYRRVKGSNAQFRRQLPKADVSAESLIRESNKLHNHRVLEMLATPLSEIPSGLVVTGAGNKRRLQHLGGEFRRQNDVENYLTEALEFPVRVSRHQEENGTGYVFTNVLAPFVLGDVEDDRHRWLDEARLIRNADLHGTQCSIELLSRHVRVVLELTELISTWKWK
jgi:transcriptional regulator with XRE-family HTH domain